MAISKNIEIKELKLDLKNFRTTPQKKETDAITAMISISTERFHAIMESIIDDGYLPTENIIVLKDEGGYIVREGNRRIAALKLIHGIYKLDKFTLPASLVKKINALSQTWKDANKNIPCSIFPKSESLKVDKIVSLTHGKGEKASREKWTSVATARHNREANKTSEPALDLLEKYLKTGKNLTEKQKERWGGDYPLTVLEEAMRKLFDRLGYKSTSELANAYPSISKKSELEEVMVEIGCENLDFKKIREVYSDETVDFGSAYRLPPKITPKPTSGNSNNSSNNSRPNAKPSGTNSSNDKGGSTNTSQGVKKRAFSTNDPRHVKLILKGFSPAGKKREKVVALRDEMRKIKIKDNPIAFCFLLRSIFELSAKAYADEHGISTTKTTKNGAQDKKLADLLKEISQHITGGNSSSPLGKAMHGAMVEIGTPDRLLSVTSMNQLVHSSTFSIDSSSACGVFSNVFPLLEAMN